MMKQLFILSFVICQLALFSQGWQQEADFPGLERDDAIAVTVENKAYYGLGFAVGFVCMSDWWSFDNMNGWQQKTSFPGTPRQYAAATAVGRHVYIFGGIDQNVNYLNDLWRYNTETDSWEQLNSFPLSGRQAPACIAYHDKILVGLGRNSTTYYNDFWLYDPQLDTFYFHSTLPGGSRYYSVNSSVSGNPVVTHGKGANECKNDCVYYANDVDSWISLSESPHAGCNYVASASHYFQLYIGGGLDSSGNFLNTYYEFNLRGNQWSTLPDLPSIPRKGSSMFVLDGVLYLIGGIDSNFTRLKEIWKYDFIEIEPNEIELAPNPATTWLNIYLDESMRENCDENFIVSLYDMNGKQIIRKEESRNGLGLWFWMDVSNVKSGMYLVQFENCEGLKSKKVVVE